MHGYFLREGGSVGSLEATQKLIFLGKNIARAAKVAFKINVLFVLSTKM